MYIGALNTMFIIRIYIYTYNYNYIGTYHVAIIYVYM